MRLRLQGKLDLLTITLLALGLASFSAIYQINYDLSLGYEIGLRQLQGQVMYKDYYGLGGMPWGVLCALFLSITPTVGWSIILASSLLNVAAAVIVWRIVLLLTQERRYAFYAGVVSAFWFLPPMGGTSIDLVAYVIGLSGFLVYLSTRAFSPNLRYFLTAGLFALAIHVKQSVGAFIFLSFLVSYALLFRKDFFSWHVRMISFYLLSQLLILGLIYCYTDLFQYCKYVFYGALNYGAGTKDFTHLLTFLLVPFGIDPLKMIAEFGRGRLLFYPVVLLFYLSYFTWYRLRREEKPFGSPELAMGLIFLVLSTLWCSALLNRLYTCCAFGLGGIVGLNLFAWRRITTKRQELIAVSLLCSLAAILTAQHCDFFKTEAAVFRVNVNKELFPIRVNSKVPYIQNLRAVIEFMADKQGPISIIDNEVFLVSLALRRAPTNPCLIYCNNDAIIPIDSALRKKWQLAFIDALEKRNSRYFISNIGTGFQTELQAIGGDFIETLEVLYFYVQRHYELVYQSGPIQVYQRKNETHRF